MDPGYAGIVALIGVARAATMVWPTPERPQETLEQGWERLYGAPRPQPWLTTTVEGVTFELLSEARLVLRRDHYAQIYQLRFDGAAPTVGEQMLRNFAENVGDKLERLTQLLQTPRR